MDHTKYLKYVLLIIPLIFYLGVRLNPTLNKEEKIWGSFDLYMSLSIPKMYRGLRNTKHRD